MRPSVGEESAVRCLVLVGDLVFCHMERDGSGAGPLM